MDERAELLPVAVIPVHPPHGSARRVFRGGAPAWDFGFDLHEEEAMSKKAEEDAQPDALATFAATARNKGVKPASQGVSASRNLRQAG
jgi:hypothetical protein